MTYNRSQRTANIEALKERRRIATAEATKAENELSEIREIERDLERSLYKRHLAEYQLQEARKRVADARAQMLLPPIIHGGREGLKAAVNEVAEHHRRKRAA